MQMSSVIFPTEKKKGVKSVKHTRIAVVTYDDQEAVLIQKKSNLQKKLFLKSHKIVLQTEIKWFNLF